MRTLSINTFATLDGVMQAPGGPEEDTSDGFMHGGWSFHYWDDVMGQIMDDYLGKRFDLLLGRKTYEIFAGYWPQHNDQPTGEALNDATKYVASRTLERVEWQNSQLLKGDVIDEIKKLKQQAGPEIQVHGSANLIQTLLPGDVVDEMRVWTFPVVLGTGKRLFAEGTVPRALRLVDSRTSSSGVIISTYQPAGEVTYDSF